MHPGRRSRTSSKVWWLVWIVVGAMAFTALREVVRDTRRSGSDAVEAEPAGSVLPGGRGEEGTGNG